MAQGKRCDCKKCPTVEDYEERMVAALRAAGVKVADKA